MKSAFHCNRARGPMPRSQHRRKCYIPNWQFLWEEWENDVINYWIVGVFAWFLASKFSIPSIKRCCYVCMYIYIYIYMIYIRRPRPTQGGARKGRRCTALLLFWSQFWCFSVLQGPAVWAWRRRRFWAWKFPSGSCLLNRRSSKSRSSSSRRKK